MTLVRNSIKEQVYIEIRNRIFDRRLLPGEAINIAHLSAELGVSNSPIREALAMLETEGLAVSTANTKFRVVSLDNELIQELNRAILVVLTGSVEICLRTGRMEELETSLRTVLQKQKEVTAQTPKESIYRLAIEFDRTIAAEAKNRFLIAAFNRWANLLYMSTALMSSSSDNSIQEHQAILDAVSARDPEEIIRQLEIHYDKSIKE